MIAGALISCITLANNAVFEVDHRTYLTRAQQARARVREIERFSAREINLNSEEDRKSLRQEIDSRLNRLSDLRENIYHQHASILLLPSVYAHSVEEQLPAWITKPPSDRSNLHFVGVGEGRTLREAKESSHRNATSQAVNYLTFHLASEQQAGPESMDTEAPSRYLVESVQVEDTHFNYDQSSGSYRYYTLIKLNRRVADTNLKLFALQQKVAVPLEFSQELTEHKIFQRRIKPLDELKKEVAVFVGDVHNKRPTDVVVFKTSGLNEEIDENNRITYKKLKNMLAQDSILLDQPVSDGEVVQFNLAGRKFSVQVRYHWFWFRRDYAEVKVFRN